MQGFKPRSRSAKACYADGGLVSTIKNYLGVGSRQAPQAQPAQQPAATPATPPPAAADTGILANATNAIRNRQQQIDEASGFANGGVVRGPGTGTSDDVPKKVKPGTFIMPADSTGEIGEEVLQELGEPASEERTETLVGEKAEQRKPEVGKEVPVNLSNGEYEMPPEQVHAIGSQVLSMMKNKTHTPVAAGGPAGFKPQAFFADGGMVEDPRKPKTGIANEIARHIPAIAPFAEGSDTRAVLSGTADDVGDQFSKGNYARGVGTALRGALATVPAVAADQVDATRRDLAPIGNAALGFGKGLLGIDDKPAAAPASPATPAAAPAATNPAAPSTPPATTEPAAVAPPPTPSSAPAPELTNNVTRVGNSYSGSNIGENFTINGKPQSRGGYVAGEPGGDMAAASQTNLGFRPAAVPTPPVGGPNIAFIGDSGRDNNQRQAILDAASTPFKGSPGGQLTANQLRVMADLQTRDQQDATTRYTTDANNQAAQGRTLIGEQGANERAEMTNQTAAERTQAANTVDMERLNMDREAQGFKTRGAQREEKLYQQYEAAKSPEERAAIAQSIRDLTGKREDLRDNFMTVGGGQEFDQASGTMRNVPQRLIDLRTGQDVASGSQQQAPIDQNPAALAIKNNTKLSKEERVAQLRALGYQ